MVKRLLIGVGLGLALAGCASPAKQSAQSLVSERAPRFARHESGTNRDRRRSCSGAERCQTLLLHRQTKYFDGARFYRVVPGFVVQWGAAAAPAVAKRWDITIPDDSVKASNTRGTMAFAATGEPNSRTTHVFISLGDNARLDAMGFAPIGRVTSGMRAVDHIYSAYGEQPDQRLIEVQGNAYLEKEFPRLDYIKTARIVSGSR